MKRPYGEGRFKTVWDHARLKWTPAVIARALPKLGLIILLALGWAPAGLADIFPFGEETAPSRLSNKPRKFMTKGDIPDRPPLLLEIGDPFLGTGNLGSGFELPGGAVWQPRLWIFGTMRSSVQTIDTVGNDRITEWANRFDLFANLQLTGTEKLVVGIRPLDRNRPDEFSGYRYEPENQREFRDFFNANVRTLFFEGDFGSLLPDLDKKGQSILDFGFTVGRQPLNYQDGILLNDTIDAVGVVRNNIRLPGVSNLRWSAVWGWNEVTKTRGGTPAFVKEDLQLYGMFTQWDMSGTTVNFDSIYVEDQREDGDGVYVGVSAAQQQGRFNTTYRSNMSFALDDATTLVTDGVLFSAEVSWTPHRSDDTIYINPFVALGEFQQAGREFIDGGGPLAPIGILFASPNIGQFGSELSNRANDVAGVALGYQAFWNDHRRNLTLEFAYRQDLGDVGDSIGLDSPGGGVNQYGIGFKLQQKVGQRILLQLEGFGAYEEDFRESYGGRFEILYQF